MMNQALETETPTEITAEPVKTSPRTGKFSERRTSVEIVGKILEITRSWTNKTKVIYLANLNFARAMKYLEILEKSGLIIKRKGLYKTSERGLQCINDLDKIKQYTGILRTVNSISTHAPTNK